MTINAPQNEFSRTALSTVSSAQTAAPHSKQNTSHANVSPRDELKKISLADKYTKDSGRVFLTGLQALVRLPIVQRKRDAAAGLNTAGFISGYRGSPLGGYDLELARAAQYLDGHDIVFEPGINEDLAATAVWGTQQLHLSPGAEKDGVFGIWYGKGPGVDRSMDVLRHGAAAGSAPLGGVLCIAGDDHAAKSSSLPHQTDHNFMTAFMPLLYPSGHHELVEFGLLGLAMSRYSGCWVGFKAVSETVEASGTVDLGREWQPIVLPTDFDMPPGGFNLRWPDPPREQDRRLQREKGFAALAFARANKIDRIVWDSPNPRIGIMTSGKSYQDVRQALYELGVDEQRAADIGLRLYKVGMPWPLEPEGARHFCEGLDEVLVVEEKRELIEHQLKWQLFNWRPEVRPTVIGKHDERDRWLLPPENDLSVGLIAHVIADRLSRYYTDRTISEKLDAFKSNERKRADFRAPITRPPYYCSGCPHNTSTKVPEGSRALAGIGCHYMAINMDRHTETCSHMGGEGVAWVGQSPFTKEKHIFANLGDGTYSHSGLQAIRAALAAGINITYKILYNDAVAMTGGQPVEGGLTVSQIVQQLKAFGVEKIAIASESPHHLRHENIPPSVPIHDRRDFEGLQKKFADTRGVSVLIYDQTCAAEKRRRRKRGHYPDPQKRIVINQAVCEGCGDCSDQSNCVSIEPVETMFGRKRMINQSTCNKDYSCVKGFCPSFVEVTGSHRKRHTLTPEKLGEDFSNTPDPTPAPTPDQYNILVTGIGGTGVLTIGALLGMAAHLESKQSLVSDMTGLAQKGGAVLSHIRIGNNPDSLHSSRIMAGSADLVLGCDKVVAASPESIDILNTERTVGVINDHMAPIADFVHHPNMRFYQQRITQAITENTKPGARFVPASEIVDKTVGDTIATNIFMLGYAFQLGHIPLRCASIEAAIELNGVAIDQNKRAFNWGRLCAHRPDLVKKIVAKPKDKLQSVPLDELLNHRTVHLRNYQNAKWARQFRQRIEGFRHTEHGTCGGAERLTRLAAINLSKLMAYKDEYEVARLYTQPEFREHLAGEFEPGGTLHVYLAPPILGLKDPATGRPRKLRFGAWIFPLFNLLKRFKKLRGAPFDPFGWTEERKQDRHLIELYEADLELVDEILTSDNADWAQRLLSWPTDISGFGPVRSVTVTTALEKRDAALHDRHIRHTPAQAA